MKIAILSFIDSSAKQNVGILKKLEEVRQTFVNNGIPSDIILVNDKQIILNEEVLYKNSNRYMGLVKLKNFIETNRYNVVFLRSIINNFSLTWFVKSLKRNINFFLVVEVPTNSSVTIKEVLNSKNINSFKKTRLILQFLLLQPLLYSYADILLVISSSGFMEKFFQKKLRIIRNGICIENTPLRKTKANTENNEIHLIGVGNISFWHGYDRVIRGIAEYYKSNPKYKLFFHIVGEGEAITSLKDLTKKLDLNDSVKFEGFKTGEDLNKIFDICDIAIGSIGIHRKQLIKSSSLKHREYCARGIPFVISDDDDDFSDEFPFVLKIPKSDEPLNMSEVIDWYESLIKEFPNYPLEMRKYAEENLTWKKKLEPLIEEIKQYFGS